MKFINIPNGQKAEFLILKQVVQVVTIVLHRIKLWLELDYGQLPQSQLLT